MGSGDLAPPRSRLGRGQHRSAHHHRLVASVVASKLGGRDRLRVGSTVADATAALERQLGSQPNFSKSPGTSCLGTGGL